MQWLGDWSNRGLRHFYDVLWCWIIRSLAAAELLFQGVLRHSWSTIRIPWGGPKYCSRPCCSPDAGLESSKSSHVGPPELLQPFFRGLAGRLSPALASPRRLCIAQMVPAAKNQATASSLPDPGLPLVRVAAPRSQSQAAIMARDVAAIAAPSTGNWMHSARETPRLMEQLLTFLQLWLWHFKTAWQLSQ